MVAYRAWFTRGSLSVCLLDYLTNKPGITFGVRYSGFQKATTVVAILALPHHVLLIRSAALSLVGVYVVTL